MSTPVIKIRTLMACFGLSVLVHLLVLISLGRFGNYSFAAPVNPLQAVMVELAKPRDEAAPAADPTDSVKEDAAEDENIAQNEEIITPSAVPEKSPTVPK